MRLFLSLILSITFAAGWSQPGAGISLPATIEEITIISPAMGKPFGAHVILPGRYHEDTTLRFPVVYLLHGHGGNYGSWPNRVPKIRELSDRYGLIIVTPDGGRDSWYIDSPQSDTSRFATYVAVEIPAYIDSTYRTVPGKEGRGITGLSMGGHGALYLALKYPETFGAAGSMSGGVDLRPFPDRWNLSQRIGSQEAFPERWEEFSMIRIFEKAEKAPDVALLIDCGTSDFFLEVNLNLHELLLQKNIPHDFILRPGAHDWNYWDNAVEYQLLFMHLYFKNSSR
jgi:S-formylglutathione hydrolase FrmB